MYSIWMRNISTFHYWFWPACQQDGRSTPLLPQTLPTDLPAPWRKPSAFSPVLKLHQNRWIWCTPHSGGAMGKPWHCSCASGGSEGSSAPGALVLTKCFGWNQLLLAQFGEVFDQHRNGSELDTSAEIVPAHQMWTMCGGWKLILKSDLNREVKSIWREKFWKIPARIAWHFPGAWSRIQCLCQFSLVFISALKHGVWRKSYWIFTKPFLHAKAFSALMFKKVQVTATTSSMCPYLFSL